MVFTEESQLICLWNALPESKNAPFAFLGPRNIKRRTVWAAHAICSYSHWSDTWRQIKSIPNNSIDSVPLKQSDTFNRRTSVSTIFLLLTRHIWEWEAWSARDLGEQNAANTNPLLRSTYRQCWLGGMDEAKRQTDTAKEERMRR